MAFTAYERGNVWGILSLLVGRNGTHFMWKE